MLSFKSFRRLFRRRKAKWDAPHISAILRDTDIAAFSELQQRYSWNTSSKYLNLDYYVPYNVRLCERIGLTGTKPSRILDIGCGTGILLRCARHFGHTGVGIDWEHDLYAEAAALHRVDRRVAPVKPFVPLDVDGVFDYVTCIATSFDKYWGDGPKPIAHWRCGEWEFFLSDVRSRLTEKGVVFLLLNERNDPKLDAAFTLGHLRKNEYRFDRPNLDRLIDKLGQQAAH